jgi:hypothetical protein
MEATGGIATKSEVGLHNRPELFDGGTPFFICNNDRGNDFDGVWIVSVSINSLCLKMQGMSSRSRER